MWTRSLRGKLASMMPGIALVLLFASVPVNGSELAVSPGVYLFEVAGRADHTLADAFGGQLTGGDRWADAPRVIKAGGDTPRAAWFNRRDGRWHGTLDRLRPGRYWLVLPPDTPEILLALPGVVVAGAGRAPAYWTPLGWHVEYGEQGLSVKYGPQPGSSADYRVTPERDSTWSAGSGVFIQQGPGFGGARGDTGYSIPGTPAPPVAGWVRVELDTVWSSFGARDVFVPIPGGGAITVPAPPAFDTPPWGDEQPTEKRK